MTANRGSELAIIVKTDQVFHIKGRTDALGIFSAFITHSGASLAIEGVAVEALQEGKPLMGRGKAKLYVADASCDVVWRIP